MTQFTFICIQSSSIDEIEATDDSYYNFQYYLNDRLHNEVKYRIFNYTFKSGTKLETVIATDENFYMIDRGSCMYIMYLDTDDVSMTALKYEIKNEPEYLTKLKTEFEKLHEEVNNKLAKISKHPTTEFRFENGKFYTEEKDVEYECFKERFYYDENDLLKFINEMK